MTLAEQRVVPSQAAEKAAEDDRRTLSAFVEKLLVDHLRKLGYLKSKK
jgi:hypothetical protein